ncbi:bifunctional glutamate--cysteine ligase GshA/glutathione synthetase GshB [Saccharicrinis aurantiacus]|uniref:bifunctional glutamate--cysteine ligase GshA/glutathione synthetase GshB n=1 Tax=Saccharicrinis aurantiacus TaxID=1849719 RepID=UPI00249292FA|nr:bifunctional glutamate--cysteine ligase GshA/glutathione synthetase GshB [Saccharicrinis aurantiacus]
MSNSVINIDAILAQNKSSRLFEGGFGFEKENVRVTPEGRLAQTPHPAVLGNKLKHPYITTDFSESQIEMITPVRHSITEALGFLETLHDEVSMHLDEELLWPQSAPPELPDSELEIPIAKFDAEGADLEEYRRYLADNYGRKKQMLSGVHVNVSFNEALLEHMYKNSGETSFSYDAFREQVYLKTLRNFKRYRWFLIALLSNSPAVHASYVSDCVKHLSPINTDAYHLPHAVSMRNSMCGYRNKQNLFLNYNTIAEYNKSINDVIDRGVVKHVKENYASVRIKSADADKDITHLEVRLLDLNPFEKIGVNADHVQVIHQFLVYCLLKPELNTFDKAVQERAWANHEQAASFSLKNDVSIIDDNDALKSINEAMSELLNDVLKYTADILPKSYEKSSSILGSLVYHPSERPAFKMMKQLQQTTFIDWNLNKAKEYLELGKQKTYNFYGLEDMELSTQLLMREAIFRGVQVDVMDRTENFIKLSKANKTEYVMQATRTSLDNYASVLLMENKVMTKKVLHSANITVPQGSEYDSPLQALNDFSFYKNQAIVIKPKSTNFGLGITIIKNNDTEAVFERAIHMAFEHDSTVLIESFVSGKEYRFFVIKDKVEGILHRVPANVKGDGTATIAELVKEKNKSALRGKGYKTPLEKIAMGEPEEMFLESQNLAFDSVPEANEIVYLRENSNISTGGDSIDFTDDIHPSYKQIAVDASKALNVQITGLDMMIDDIAAPATADNYSIIEMNFNPAIHIHCHPFKGENRKLNVKLLQALELV